MNNTELQNDQPNNSFFIDRGPPKKQEKKSESEETQIPNKTINRKLDKPYNIHFTTTSEIFQNIITFINEISYDVALIFRKNEMLLITIGPENVHIAVIKFDKGELVAYEVSGLENDDSEKGILIDISVIIEELSIQEESLVDVYIDTVHNHRYYVINKKEIVERQLEIVNTADGVDGRLKRYRQFGLVSMPNLINNKEYQKIVVNQFPISNLIASLGKKVDKTKETLCTLLLTRHSLDWTVQNEVRSSSIMLSGDDVLVYPLENDKLIFNLGYLTKLKKLKLTFGAALYICGNRNGNPLPLIFETKFGGNGINLKLMIAPKVEEQ